MGAGRFEARILIPSQSPFPARGRLLAFNARLKGRRVVLAHIFGTTRVLTGSCKVRPRRR